MKFTSTGHEKLRTTVSEKLAAALKKKLFEAKATHARLFGAAL